MRSAGTRPTPTLGTLIYCLRDHRVLLMRRRKEPNLGLWVAPGGKVEPGESPYECALRELVEETGLRAHGLRLRGLVTETSPRPDWQWLLFIYVTATFEGSLRPDEREGELRWWSLDAARHVPMPEADKVFFPRVIDLTRPLYQARFVYDGALRLVEVVEHPGG